MKAALIGSGIGNLTVALYLLQAGIDVIIYEKSKKVGGRLTFHEHDTARIDAGPTIVLLPEMLKSILKGAGIHENALQFIPIDPMYRLYFPSGSVLVKHRDPLKQKQELNRFLPGEGDRFYDWFQKMDRFFEKGKQHVLEKNFISFLKEINKDLVKLLIEMKSYQTMYQAMTHTFQSKELQEAYSLQSLYVGGNPFKTPSLYHFIPYAEHKFSIWYVKGGYGTLPSLLEKEIKKRGGNILKNSEVQKLHEENGIVQSIEVNGKKEPVDIVVYNGDFPIVQSLTRKKIVRKKYEPSSSCVLFYVGLKETLPELDVHQFIMGKDFKQHMKDVFIEKKIPSDPSIYLFYPSKIDDSLTEVGKSVLYVLVPVPANPSILYEQETEWKGMVMNKIETIVPRFREKVEWMHMRTPTDAYKDGFYYGGNFGISPSLFQSGPFRPQVKPFKEIDNLYSVGASIHPGGGVPIVMQGAKNLIDLLVQEQKISFNKEEVRNEYTIRSL